MKYTAEEFRKEVQLAITAGRATVFRDFFEDNQDWEELHHLIDEGYHDKVWDQRPSGNPALEPAIGRLLIRGRFYITIRLNSDGAPFEGIKGGYDFLKEVAPNLEASHSVVNFVGREQGIETVFHSDPVHTFYWQLKGTSRWLAAPGKVCVHCAEGHDIMDQMDVNPGDLLFLPRGMFHTVHVLEPRAAVIFRFEQDDEFAVQGPLDLERIYIR